MLERIESLLLRFRECFNRERTFRWFVIIVVSLMVRHDQLGVTSIIREFDLNRKSYECLINFFRSRAYSLKSLRKLWYKTVLEHAPLYRVDGRAVLVGDGVKQSKEAFLMPAVKKMAQESETCSKPQFIHGHFFGATGIVLGNEVKHFCLPLKVNIQDGLRALASWKVNSDFFETSDRSHVEQMIDCGFEVASTIGRSFLLLDRYFLTRTALIRLNELNAGHDEGNGLVVIITKAKMNCNAFHRPNRKSGAKGRPPKRGSSVKLSGLFQQHRLFTKTKVRIYDKEETVSYYCKDLLWGPGLYQRLRFVLVEYDGKRSILVSTDTTLEAEKIIRLYAMRFGIESLFREFKQQLGGFSYHFWTTGMTKLNHFAKKDSPDPLSLINDPADQKKILLTLQAIEMFVFCASVAMGLLQVTAFDSKLAMECIEARYLRTPSKATPSEATVQYYFRQKFYAFLLKHPDSAITRFIQSHQHTTFDTASKKMLA